MRKKTICIAVCLIVLFSIHTAFAMSKKVKIIEGGEIDMFGMIKGNGEIISSELSLSEFDGIESSGYATIQYFVSDEYRAVISIDSNLMDLTNVHVKNNKLNISMKKSIYNYKNFQVDVYSPTLSSVSISGAGDFTSEDTITATDFNLSISGAGNASLVLDCQNVDASISGAGNLSLSGKADKMSVKQSGAGNLKSKDMIVKDLTTSISGAGNAEVHATESLNAKVSGVGKIKYHGNPTVINTNVSGVGSIKKAK